MHHKRALPDAYDHCRDRGPLATAVRSKLNTHGAIVCSTVVESVDYRGDSVGKGGIGVEPVHQLADL